MSMFRVALLALVLALCARVSAQTPQPLTRPVIFTTATGSTDGVEWSGSGNEVRGALHSNAHFSVTGASNAFSGPVTYVGTLQAGSATNVFASAPSRVEPRPSPYAFDIRDFAPGAVIQQTLAAKYFDRSSDCRTGGKWVVDA